jgi:CheY-like chemotaxis protein
MATVLVVDDDEVARTVLATKLNALGHETAFAGDRAGALEQAHVLSPDVVLLDIGLPDGNALGLIQTLRALPDLGELPILVVSAREAAETEDEALEAGASGYFEKSHGIQPIVDAVVQALSRS